MCNYPCHVRGGGEPLKWLVILGVFLGFHLAVGCPNVLATPIFGEPVSLNDYAASDSANDLEPTIETNGSGVWIVIWFSEHTFGGTIGSDRDILYSRSTDNGDTWSPAAPLNSNAGSDSGADEFCEMATDRKGVWIVTWRSTEAALAGTDIGTDQDILFSRSIDDGLTWSDPALLNTNGAGDSGDDAFPRITTDCNGNWVAKWQSKENLGGNIGTDADVFVTRSSDNGVSWTAPSVCNSNAPSDGIQGDSVADIVTDRLGRWVALLSSIGSTDGSDGVLPSPLPGYEIVHEPVNVEIAEDTGLPSAFLEGFEAEVVKTTPLCSGGQWQFNRPGNGVAVRHYVVEDMDLAESGLGIGAYIKANFTSGESTLPHHNLLWVGSQIDHDGNTSLRRTAFKIRGWTTGGGYGAPFDFDVSNAANPVTFRLDTDGSFKWIKSGQTNWAASTVDYDGPDGSAATGVVPDGWSVYMAYAAKNSTTEEIYPSPLNVIHENCNGTIGFDGDILRTISTDNGATWTPAAPVNTNATTDCGDDQGGLLVIDGNGDYIATWCSYDNLDCTIDSGRDVLFARSTDNCATWSAPAHLNSNATTDGPDDCITALVSDGQGNLIAVWVSDDNLNDTIGDDFDILLSFSNDNGITWSPAAKLNFNADTDSGAGPDSGRDGDPDLATDGSGNWVAVWRSNDDTLLNTIGDDYDILAATIFYVPVGLSSFSLE